MTVYSMPLPGQTSAGRDLSVAPWWPVFRALRLARGAFGLKARHLTTLAALLSFLKPDDRRMMVFASNAVILERLNGLSERSLQRHVIDLITAGLMRRVDSPNGKRFRLRGPNNDSLSFGFDLTPLLGRADDITREAEAETERGQRLAVLRQHLLCALAQRESAGASEADLRPARLALRRALTEAELTALHRQLSDLAPASRPEDARQPEETAQMHPAEPSPIPAQFVCDRTNLSGSDGQNVGQYHKSNTEDSFDKAKTASNIATAAPINRGDLLRLLRTCCPNIGTWLPNGYETWDQILSQTRQVAGWLGISDALYTQAEQIKGAECTAATVLGILDRSDRIHQPGAYFRSLTIGSRQAAFSAQRLSAWLAQGSRPAAVIRG